MTNGVPAARDYGGGGGGGGREREGGGIGQSIITQHNFILLLL